MRNLFRRVIMPCNCGGGIGSEAYSGLAVAGRVQAIVGFLIAVIIALALFFAADKLITSKYSISATGTVLTSVPCRPPTGNGGNKYSCIADVSYSVNGVSHTAPSLALKSDRPLSKGDSVALSVSRNNSSQVEQGSPGSRKEEGFGLVGFGLVMLLMTGGAVFITGKSKAASAEMGGVDLISDL